AGLLPKALVITTVCQLCLYWGDLYDNPHTGGNHTELLIRILLALGATCLVLAAIYALFPALIIARGVLAPAAVLAVTGVIAWRVTFGWIARRVGPRERLLMVGTSAAGFALARELHEREELGVQIVGLVDVQPVAPSADPGLAFLGGIEDIPSIVRARSVDRVVVSLADARGKLPMQKLLEMKLDGVQFDYLASVYEEYTGKIAIENLRPSWLIFSPGFRKTPRLLAVKRVIDVVSALIGLVLATPLLLVLAVIIKVTSPGPVFYSQRRVGCDSRIFTVYKLRSMCADAERNTGPVWAPHQGDARVTRIGRFMRRTRLDEIPQFWNILAGHMSLVGPRPERPEFVESLARDIPFYGQRHVIKPGLTGWAQVRYTYGATVEEAMEKLQFDLFYIKHLSVTLDLFIIFETVKTVLLRRGH
ncbi:MAG: TIGR03013 family XrtA/PEP-CTERM system glycosyltransferase, partial [Vicinamibacterales bacterium]